MYTTFLVTYISFAIQILIHFDVGMDNVDSML